VNCCHWGCDVAHRTTPPRALQKRFKISDQVSRSPLHTHTHTHMHTFAGVWAKQECKIETKEIQKNDLTHPRGNKNKRWKQRREQVLYNLLFVAKSQNGPKIKIKSGGRGNHHLKLLSVVVLNKDLHHRFSSQKVCVCVCECSDDPDLNLPSLERV
jgi:hypothetical protein